MLVEQLIFIVVSFALFVLMFIKMIKNNDTTYVIFLALEAVGIAIVFMEVLFSLQVNALFKVFMYIFSVILPIIILILEKKGIVNVAESLNIYKAKFYFSIGNNKKAKQILIDLLDKNINSYKGHKLLAEIYEAEGGMRKAIDEYVQAIDLNKKDYDSYYKVANLLNDLDKKNEASQMLTSLLRKKPDYKDASILLGDLLIEKNMYKEAINVYLEATKYNPLDFDLNYNLGIAYTMINDFQSAKEYYDKAAEINELIYNCKYSLAEIALIYKELDKAEKLFMQTIDDEELGPDSYYELSKIYLIRGDKERAIQYANTAVSLSPKKISEKIKNESMFIPILARISMPFNLIEADVENENEEENVKKKKLTVKEVKAKEHLEDMFELAKQLGYNDILMKMNRGTRSDGGRGIETEETEKSEELDIDDLDSQKEIQD